jgi:2-amino-4-hydroxy-6-hydroxymethyldihydropteridine diphosphokinase
MSIQGSRVAAFVALGSNLEDPRHQVEAGLAALARLPRTTRLACSSLYATAPVGYADQPDFVNAVAAVETALAARALLQALLETESRHGRRRTFPNAPRTLDLDLLLYGGQVIDEPGLIVPHPRMHDRAFVLVPLAEIAPDAFIAGHGTAGELAAHVDTSGIKKL